jgi:hypothetical protein
VKTSLLRRIWGPSGARLLAGDAVVLGLLVAAVVAASLPGAAGGHPSHAEVTVSGQKALSLELARNDIYEVPGPIGVTRIEVRDGKVRILSSPCPRQVCRHGGWIGAPGELLVCLPNELVVRVAGERSGGPDSVAR